MRKYRTAPDFKCDSNVDPVNVVQSGKILGSVFHLWTAASQLTLMSHLTSQVLVHKY